MSFLSMLTPVAEDLRRVDALIGARLDSDVALVRDVASYIVAAGGKRLRPALLLLACGAAGVKAKPVGEARLVAVLAHAPASVEAALADYGMHVGSAFQLVDDVLDYSGDAQAIGKSLGDDLAEGKPTLPLIHAIRAGTPAQAAVIRKSISEGGRDDFAAVLDVIRACGSLEYARGAAQKEVAAAISAVAALAESKYKDSLLELASFSVTRTS